MREYAGGIVMHRQTIHSKQDKRDGLSRLAQSNIVNNEGGQGPVGSVRVM